MSYEGELAGLFTALLFAFSSLGFAMASRRVGSFVVNQLRILLAVLFLVTLHLALFGRFWPEFLSNRQAYYLVVSGIIGLTLGDLFYFHALGLVGPRLGTLLMSTFPIFTVLAYGFLGEGWPDLLQATGMVVTLTGVTFVLGAHKAATPARLQFARSLQRRSTENQRDQYPDAR